jgi:hypothetical protein
MIVVVGGHSRNIGKTWCMCTLISETPELHWNALKVTQYGHSACSADGGDCNCAPKSTAHPYAIDEQMEPDSTDTGRYLAAGARRAFWIRTRAGELAEAMPQVRQYMALGPNTIIESNSVMDFLFPDAYVFVEDPTVSDFKLSAQRHLKRADRRVRFGEVGLGEWLRDRVRRREAAATIGPRETQSPA